MLVAATSLAMFLGSMGSMATSAYAARPVDDGSARRVCNPQPPDYPGCSTAQINDWEDGDVAAAKAHYPQDRWGQSGFTWNNLGDAHNDKMRRLYNDAVDAYTAKQEARGLTGKAAQPKFDTWGDFKAGTDCAGGFWGAAWSTMCRFSNAVDNVVPDLTDATLVCGGWALIGHSVAKVVALIFETVAPEAAAAAVVGTTAYCTLVKLAGALGIPTPKSRLHTSEHREHAIHSVLRSARRALNAVLPFADDQVAEYGRPDSPTMLAAI
jgi:hypothetical protein